MSDRFPTSRLPGWLDEAELDERAADLARTGATGALNRYRNIDRDWEDLAAWEGAALRQPSLFLAGAHDPSLAWMADAIDAFPTTLPGLRIRHVVEGAGHWVHEERPGEVGQLLSAFLLDESPPAATTCLTPRGRGAARRPPAGPPAPC